MGMTTKELMKRMDDVVAELLRRELSDPVNKDVWMKARVAITDSLNEIVAMQKN